MTGKIMKGIGGFYYVHAEDGVVYECRGKGIFRKEKIKPLPGDNVEISETLWILIFYQKKKKQEI